MNKTAGVQNLLCDYLEQSHRGEGNAISSRELERIFHLKGADVRRMVNLLRSESKPICSNAMGYFYAADMTELRQTISQLNGRVQMIERARNGLMKYLAEHEKGSENNV